MKRSEAKEQTREKILQAALHVFSTRGFATATNRDIADEAGIGSAGLIYHYFRDRQDLLDHVMERINPVLSLIGSPQETRKLPVREGLLRFTREVLKLAQQKERADVIRMLLGEALRTPEAARSLFAAGPGRGLTFLTKWMARHVKSGALRDLPPRQLARQFMAPLFTLVLFKVLFDLDEPINHDLAERHVDAFLEGAAPR